VLELAVLDGGLGVVLAYTFFVGHWWNVMIVVKLE